jgi:hypothetical protein
MVAPAFRRDRVRGISQADISRAVRAAKECGPGNIVEVDPIGKRIRIIARPDSADAAAKASPGDPCRDSANPWDEVLTHAADKERPA